LRKVWRRRGQQTTTRTTDDDTRSRRHTYCGFLHILCSITNWWLIYYTLHLCGFLHILCSITNWWLIYYTLHLCHADVTFSYSPQNSPLNLHQKMVKPQTNCNRKYFPFQIPSVGPSYILVTSVYYVIYCM
jgi:hypothetical protein